MKICAIIPTFKRPKITILAAQAIYRQVYPEGRVIVVGSCEGDRAVKDFVDVDYLDFPNRPLSLKVQHGIDHSRIYDPDAIMCCGSDDILSSNWIEVLYGNAGKYESISGKSLYALLPVPLTITKVSTVTRMAIGRLIFRDALKKIDWQVYSEPVSSRLDYYSFIALAKAKIHVHVYESDDIKCLSIKGPWHHITSWSRTAGKNRALDLDNPESWLTDFFPEVLPFLSDLEKKLGHSVR